MTVAIFAAPLGPVGGVGRENMERHAGHAEVTDPDSKRWVTVFFHIAWLLHSPPVTVVHHSPSTSADVMFRARSSVSNGSAWRSALASSPPTRTVVRPWNSRLIRLRPLTRS